MSVARPSMSAAAAPATFNSLAPPATVQHIDGKAIFKIIDNG